MDAGLQIKTRTLIISQLCKIFYSSNRRWGVFFPFKAGSLHDREVGTICKISYYVKKKWDAILPSLPPTPGSHHLLKLTIM